jgi:hypothetical protein
MPPLVSQLQSLKDGIVVIEMGADALPFLTTLGTLPASLAYFNFYRFTLVRAQLLAGACVLAGTAVKQTACRSVCSAAFASQYSQYRFTLVRRVGL